MGAGADVTIASRASGREHRRSAASSIAPTCSIMRASQREASLSLQILRTAADVQHRSRSSRLTDGSRSLALVDFETSCQV